LELKEIVLATENPHKVQEIENILGHILKNKMPTIKTLKDFPRIQLPAETGSTFEENAKIKAGYVARASQLPALADDSGLVVEELGGRPGIHSARFAGPQASDEANRKKLIQELKTHLSGKAKFVCCLCLALPQEGQSIREIITIGEVRGEILLEETGSGGFGYDPLFFVPDLGKTYAQCTEEEKNRHSHRFRALQALFRNLG